MAKWVVSKSSWTPVGVSDGSVYTDSGYICLIGGSATQRIDISEIEMAGMSSSTAPTPMLLSRDSVLGATLTAFTGAGEAHNSLEPTAVAPTAAPVAFSIATTKPQRAATSAKLALGFNAYGGLVRWNANPGFEYKLLGNAAFAANVGGEVSLSCYSGTTPGAIMSHIIYEPM